MTAGVVVALDQVTKALVKDEVLPGEHVDLFPGLQLSNVRNTGVAFGALEGAGLAVALLIGLSLTLLIGYFVANRELPLLWLPVGMLVGGAVGNLIDRAREGAVMDFIDPVGWPAFNVADSCIVLACRAAPVRGGEGGPTDRVDLTAGAADEGTRLDAFLAAHTEVGSRAAAQRAIDAGRVTVDGRRRPKSHRMAAGESVAVEQAEEAPSEPESVAFEVVYEDDHLLVVDKPAGLVTHPAPGHSERRSRRRCGAARRAARIPSGPASCTGSTATPPACWWWPSPRRPTPSWCDMLGRREIERGYIALVTGQPDAASGTIDAPLGRDRARRDVVSTRTARGRPAVTHFEVRERLPRTTLLDLRLETGRTHQIRAHLAAIGHPVCGDARYGGAACGRRLGLDRQFLHAARLDV